MSTKWSKVKLGTLVTGFETDTSSYYDNLIVVHVAHDWAVLRQRDGSRVVSSLLEPDDDYSLGEYEYNEGTGTLDYKEQANVCTCNST